MNSVTADLTRLIGQFNGLDWLIMAVVLASLLLGIVRGFAREALSLMGWVCAFIGANLLAKPLAASLLAMSDSATLRYLVGWGLVFFGVLAIFSVLVSVLARQLRQPGFNIGNRFLGAVFGIARGLVIMMVVTLMLKGMLPDSEEDWLDRAQLVPILEVMADWFSENVDDVLQSNPVETVDATLESQELL